jgi:hypothetical protein
MDDRYHDDDGGAPRRGGLPGALPGVLEGRGDVVSQPSRRTIAVEAAVPPQMDCHAG